MLNKWAPRIDGDLFPSDYEELTKNAPRKPTYMGVVEEECYMWSKRHSRPVSGLHD